MLTSVRQIGIGMADDADQEIRPPRPFQKCEQFFRRVAAARKNAEFRRNDRRIHRR